MSYLIIILAAISWISGGQYWLDCCVFFLLIDSAIVRYDLNNLFKLNDLLRGNLASLCDRMDHSYEITNELRTEIITLKRFITSRLDG